MMKEYSQQFITNNLPPYNTKITILNLRLSCNKIVAVADVFQEATRKRELAGKVREVKTSVLQTETWIHVNNEWKLKLVDNVHDQKRYVEVRGLTRPNRMIPMILHSIRIKTNESQ